jgi:uncharacterized protein
VAPSAAEQGEAKAQTFLGLKYEYGRGVPQDLVQAHLWYNLAASRSQSDDERDVLAAKWRDELAERMTPEQLALAQDMARDWRPKPKQPPKQGRIVTTEELFGKAPGEKPGAQAAIPQPPPGYRLVEPTPPQASQAQVAEAQVALAALGYDPGPADGILGSKTRTAIRAYQAAVGLSVDGEVTDALLDSLRSALAHAETTAPQPENNPELYAAGTGFVVSRAGHVLTNLHVVRDCTLVRARRGNAQGGIAGVAAMDSENDLALLLPKAPRFGQYGEPVEVAPSSEAAAPFREGRGLRPGDSVVAVGFPLQGLLASSANVTTGTVSAMAGIRDDARYLQITAPIQPGNSGGPLLDLSGNVVGVVVAKLDALKVAEAIGDIPQNVNFAIKDSVARSFLDAKGIEYETASSDRELTAAEVGERAAAFTVLVECWK